MLTVILLEVDQLGIVAICLIAVAAVATTVVVPIVLIVMLVIIVSKIKLKNKKLSTLKYLKMKTTTKATQKRFPKIKTFEQALKKTGLPYRRPRGLFTSREQYKLFVIARALNGKDIIPVRNHNHSFYPISESAESSKKSAPYMPCFKTAEMAEYAAKQHRELFSSLLK